MFRLVVVGMNFVTCAEPVMRILENMETIIIDQIASIIQITYKLIRLKTVVISDLNNINNQVD